LLCWRGMAGGLNLGRLLGLKPPTRSRCWELGVSRIRQRPLRLSPWPPAGAFLLGCWRPRPVLGGARAWKEGCRGGGGGHGIGQRGTMAGRTPRSGERGTQPFWFQKSHDAADREIRSEIGIARRSVRLNHGGEHPVAGGRPRPIQPATLEFAICWNAAPADCSGANPSTRWLQTSEPVTCMISIRVTSRVAGVCSGSQ